MKKKSNNKENLKENVLDNSPTIEKITVELWHTLQLVKSHKLRPVEANAISRASLEMQRLARLQLEYAKLLGNKAIKSQPLMLK